MNTLLILCSLMLYATLDQASGLPADLPEPPSGPVFPPIVPDQPFSFCGQRWDCKHNCTEEKKALQTCCSRNKIPSSTENKDFCGSICSGFENAYLKCLKTCQPKPKSCPTGNSLPKDFCQKACSHGRANSFPEREQCLFTMSMVSPLCKPYCHHDKHCPADEKCCPSACSFSCQKPV